MTKLWRTKQRWWWTFWRHNGEQQMKKMYNLSYITWELKTLMVQTHGVAVWTEMGQSSKLSSWVWAVSRVVSVLLMLCWCRCCGGAGAMSTWYWLQSSAPGLSWLLARPQLVNLLGTSFWDKSRGATLPSASAGHRHRLWLLIAHGAEVRHNCDSKASCPIFSDFCPPGFGVKVEALLSRQGGKEPWEAASSSRLLDGQISLRLGSDKQHSKAEAALHTTSRQNGYSSVLLLPLLSCILYYTRQFSDCTRLPSLPADQPRLVSAPAKYEEAIIYILCESWQLEVSTTFRGNFHSNRSH